MVVLGGWAFTYERDALVQEIIRILARDGHRISQDSVLTQTLLLLFCITLEARVE